MEFLTNEGVSRTLEGAASVSPFEELKKQVEAILFAAEHAMEVSEIRNIIGEVSLSDVRLALRDLMADYQPRSFFLFECGGKYQLRTRPEYAELVKKQFASKPRSLSKSALETLAIVAYRQPVTRSEVNTIRQVDSSSIMTALKEKDLIAVAGQRKEVGSPMEYKTTQRFLETFGLKTLADLPSLRSLQMKPEDQEQMAQALARLNGEEPDEPELNAQDLSFQDPIESSEGALDGASAFQDSADAPLETETTEITEPAESLPHFEPAEPQIED
ncbi:MAG: SMC-Scp complex subunit ScpB [Betaproteobacteria bacterium]|nr:SMC-Scp complex subunit ScpB [Betaproteobacteria bacterium]